MAWIHPPAIGCRFSFLHIPCGRCGHTAVLYNSSLLIFGGFDGKRWLNDLHSFDSTSLVWSQPRILGVSPNPRQYHTAAICDSRMFIFGGYNGAGWLKDLVVLDLLNYRWLYPKTYGTIPLGREGHTMITYGKSLYIHGGWDGGTIGDLYKLSVDTYTWEKIEITGEKPILCGHSVNIVERELFIFGGFDGVNWVNNLYRLNLENYNCVKCDTRGEPIPRGYHSATLVNRYILIWAGYNGKFILGDLVALDTENLVWSLPDPCLGHFPTARNAHTITMLGSELFMFGGYNGTRDTNDLHILETAAFSSLQDDMKMGMNCKAGLMTEIGSRGNLFMVHTVLIITRCPKLLQTEDRKDLNVSKQVLELLIEYIYCDLSSEKIPVGCLDELRTLAAGLSLDRLKHLCNNELETVDSTLTSDVMHIRSLAENSDFTVEIENTDFLLHKVILAARCPYFRAMFQTGMSENSKNRIALEGFKVGAFEFIVEWIYSDKFSPLFGNAKLEVDEFIEILIQSNMLGLESLMRMTEMAAQDTINVDNVIKLYEVAYSLGAVRLKSYAVNFILREFDKVALKKDLANLSEGAFEELNLYLPRRLKRQTSKNGFFPSINYVKLDRAHGFMSNKLDVKPHDPKSLRLPSSDLKGILSLRNPLTSTESKSQIIKHSSPQMKQSRFRRTDRMRTQNKKINACEPIDLIVQGISPRSNHSGERSPVLKYAGLHISSSVGTLYQHTMSELTGSSKFLLYK
jgi:N-acetylneuraminic acid mutarotase